MVDKHSDNLSELIEKIQKEEILLPDFQRKFVWTDVEMQKKLVASVMAKMPIGSILLLEAEKQEYAYKRIGCLEPVANSDEEKTVKLLLDGQQRMTVLTNVFSNVIARLKFSQMSHPSLKNRFYLRIYLDDFKVRGNDIFGVNKLDMGILDPIEDEPQFLSGDVLDLIVAEPVSNDSIYRAGGKNYSVTDIYHDCCCKTEYYQFPLFLLTEEDRSTRNQDYLCFIATDLGQKIAKRIVGEYKSKNDDLKSGFAQEILGNSFFLQYDAEIRRLKTDEEKVECFEKIIKKKADTWANRFISYMKSCVNKLNINQIVLSKSQRDRAIDIYENLNKEGKALNIFDLVMARVAKVNKENFYDRVVNYIEKNRRYDLAVLPDRNRHIISSDYIKNSTDNTEEIEQQKCYFATKSLKGIDGDKNLATAYVDAFLNVMCLNANKDKGPNLQFLKKDEKLKMAPEFIDSTCELTCDALDRAFYFFQSRCGIRTIKEINYNQMLVIVAFIFLEAEKYKSKAVHNALEAWYWGSVLGGEFDTDQNNQTIQHLSKLLKLTDEILINKPDYSWLKRITQGALKKEHFSTKEFLLMGEVETLGRRPKNFLRDVICQFYLSSTYNDLTDSTRILSAFYSINETLEKHHVVPLGSVATIGESAMRLRSDQDNLLNSPLNFIYITKETNKKISDMKLEDYSEHIQGTCINALSFNPPFKTKTREDIYAILEGRFRTFESKLQSRFIELIGV